MCYNEMKCKMVPSRVANTSIIIIAIALSIFCLNLSELRENPYFDRDHENKY